MDFAARPTRTGDGQTRYHNEVQRETVTMVTDGQHAPAHDLFPRSVSTPTHRKDEVAVIRKKTSVVCDTNYEVNQA
jgi:hypothetical protein